MRKLLLLVLILAFCCTLLAQNQGRNGQDRNQERHFSFMKLKDQLTEAQIQELKDLMKNMHDNGATREEIHEAVVELLEFWGIEIPENLEEQQHIIPGGIWKQLSDEQKETLKETISAMKDNDATRDEIREAVLELLKGWDIDITELQKFRWKRFVHRKLMEQLTEEQQEELKAMIEEMKENGATGKEIHDAVAELLESWGIEKPENPGNQKHKRFLREIMEQLNDAQKAELKELIQTMHEAEATREEIHEAVTELLLSWGIELPKNWGEGPNKDEKPEEVMLKNNKLLGGITNHPNPFNPDTHISYSLQKASKVNVKIYDMAGNYVKTLANMSQEAGSYTLYWDGLNQNGTQLPSGMYLVKIEAGSETETHNMLLMK